MAAIQSKWPRPSTCKQLVKFCLVGGSGLVVDMTVLHFLASPAWCGWNVSLSKVCSAEAALLNNFFWNEVWTFRPAEGNCGQHGGIGQRLLRFHAICGLGVGLAVFFLHAFYAWLGINLYAANFMAIVLVTLWNFWLSARFNWRVLEA